MKKAVVLGAGFNALSLIRSLGTAGIDVVHLSHAPFDFARYSRFVHQWFSCPSPVAEGSQLLEYLLNTSLAGKGSFLIGSDDPSVMFLSKNREVLSRGYVPAHEPWEVIGPIISKDSLYKKAKALGVPTPNVVFPGKGDDPGRVASSVVFPCIVKPFQSTRFSAVYRKKVLIAHNTDELVKALTDTRRHGIDVMVSEIISGGDTRLCHYRSYIDSSGDLLAEMCTQKFRQHPAGFGVACAAKTIPIIPKVREQALKLLKEISFKGESSVEFKIDPKDGRYKLMEINVRSVLPEEHFTAAGINFPFLAYQDLVAGIRTPCIGYELGLYWVNNFTDTFEFLKSIGKKGGNISPARFIEPYRRRHVVCVPLLDDPKPFVAAIYKSIHRFFTKI